MLLTVPFWRDFVKLESEYQANDTSQQVGLINQLVH